MDVKLTKRNSYSLDLRSREDGYYATSKDVPGLHVYVKEPTQIYAALADGLSSLFISHALIRAGERVGLKIVDSGGMEVGPERLRDVVRQHVNAHIELTQ